MEFKFTPDDAPEIIGKLSEEEAEKLFAQVRDVARKAREAEGWQELRDLRPPQE
jgi:hypothetical protein